MKENGGYTQNLLFKISKNISFFERLKTFTLHAKAKMNIYRRGQNKLLLQFLGLIFEYCLELHFLFCDLALSKGLNKK